MRKLTVVFLLGLLAVHSQRAELEMSVIYNYDLWTSFWFQSFDRIRGELAVTCNNRESPTEWATFKHLCSETGCPPSGRWHDLDYSALYLHANGSGGSAIYTHEDF